MNTEQQLWHCFCIPAYLIVWVVIAIPLMYSFFYLCFYSFAIVRNFVKEKL